MKTGIVAVPLGVFLAALSGLAIAVVPEWAWANDTPGDTQIATTLCTVASWTTGNLGIGLAIIAVIIVGILGMLGRISWGLALMVGTGIAIIFGAGTILVALKVGALSACPSNSGSGPGGGGAGPPPLPYVDLGTTGSITKPSLILGTRNGSRVTSVVTNLDTITSPINGWLRMEFTLPPGYSISPYYWYETTGVDPSNGDTFIMGGFWNVYGNGQYPAYSDLLDYLDYNGQPYTGNTMPPGVNVQYRLYNSFAAYSQGCTTNCAETDQMNFTYNTSIPPGQLGGGQQLHFCTSGTCIAPGCLSNCN